MQFQSLFLFYFQSYFFSKWLPKINIFENVSVDIYEPRSFTKFNQRDPDINFSDDVIKFDTIKYTFKTSSFEPDKVKP